MIQPSSSNRFNAIVVLDSIPAGHLNTARRLHEDIESYASAHAPSPAVAYVRVENRVDLFNVLEECARRAAEEDLAPLLHIECHGDEDGFQLADGSLVDWLELKPALENVNVAMRLNLMIVPTNAISPQALETSYRAFYTELLATKSPSAAIDGLEAKSPPGMFWRTTAQGLFQAAWDGYRANYCTPEQLHFRSLRMKDAFFAKTGLDADPEALKQLLINHEPQAFERYRSVFFMYDLYPDHAERFPMPYKTGASSHVG